MEICTSPGFCARPPGIFSLEGTTAITLHDGFRRGDRAHRADHGGAAAHVVFHFFHVIRGLDGNSAGVKRDGFSYQAQDRRARIQLFGSVRDDDHARRLDASLRDRKQRAHFQFRNFLFVQDFDGEARLSRHGCGAVGQHARRQAVGGLVAQLAREVLRFRDDAPAREAADRHRRARILPTRPARRQ